jgi:guanylate kinase
MKRLILVGKGGSGKDYARKVLENIGFSYCVSHTTRPIRVDEIDGDDYHFIPANEIPDGMKFYESVNFNGWFYGTSMYEFGNSDLFIMTPSGVSKLKPSDRKESFIVYFDIPYDVRRERLMERKDADLADRRLDADELDFRGFTDFDYSITDPNFKVEGDWTDLLNYRGKL